MYKWELFVGNTLFYLNKKISKVGKCFGDAIRAQPNPLQKIFTSCKKKVLAGKGYKLFMVTGKQKHKKNRHINVTLKEHETLVSSRAANISKQYGFNLMTFS